MAIKPPELNLKPAKNVRVYVDIGEDVERKTRMRYLQLEVETGKRFDRKTYLEFLIEQDIARVSGASLRTIKIHSTKK